MPAARASASGAAAASPPASPGTDAMREPLEQAGLDEVDGLGGRGKRRPGGGGVEQRGDDLRAALGAVAGRVRGKQVFVAAFEDGPARQAWAVPGSGAPAPAQPGHRRLRVAGQPLRLRLRAGRRRRR